MYRKNTAGQFVCFQMLLTATGAVATGLSPAVRRCIDGTFAAGGGTVTEDGVTGAYKYAMTQADTNGNDISFIFSAATAMPVCVNIVTTAADPTDGVRLGLTSLPNAAAAGVAGLPVLDANSLVDVDVKRWLANAVAAAAAGIPKVDIDTIKTNPAVNAGTITFPTNATLASTTNITAGTISITANIKKNSIQNGFMFVMTDSVNHIPALGLAVTATRSLDGAAFGACANAVAEVANGTYVINLAAADTNADHIMLRFVAVGADDLNIEIITQP